jgi:hypothetical protein
LLGPLNDLDKITSHAVLPFAVLSGVKNGKAAEMAPYLKQYGKLYGKNFAFHLASAFMSAGEKNHKESIAHLKSAQHALPDRTDSYTLDPLYQLLETCEWLYADTGISGYRTLAHDWAKTYQRVEPLCAWLYSIEAKFSTSPGDRLRAIAMTLYLDPRSDRISSISQKEKDEALEWLKKNNPFLMAPSQQGNDYKIET